MIKKMLLITNKNKEIKYAQTHYKNDDYYNNIEKNINPNINTYSFNNIEMKEIKKNKNSENIDSRIFI